MGLICLITIASLWPLLPNIQTHIPMPSGIKLGSHASGDADPFMFCWNYYWIQGWLSNTHPLYLCTALHHPFGIALEHHTLALTNGILGFPFLLAVSPLITCNLLLMFQLLLTGTAFFLACRLLNYSILAAFAGTLIAMLWPARSIRDLVHPNLSGTGFLCMTLIFMILAMKHLKVRYLAGCMLSAAATAAMDLHQILFLVIMSVGFIPLIPGRFVRKAGIWIVVLTACLLPTIPIALPVLRSSSDFLERSIEEKERFSVDPSAFVIPDGRLLSGRLAGNPLYPERDPIESTAYLGLSVILILLIGRVWAHPGARSWLAIGGFCAILALGPTLQIGSVSIPMPYRLLSDLPGLGIMRAPGRFMIPAGFAVAFAIAALLSRFQKRPKSLFWTSSALLLLVIDLFPAPIPITSARIPSIYDHLTAPDPNRPALIDIPGDLSIRMYQYYQTQHRRPISSGFASRIPPSVFHVRDGIPLLRQLDDPQTASSALMKATPAEISDLLAILRASTIIIHRQYLDRRLALPPDMLAILWQADRWRDDGDRIVLDFSKPPKPEMHEKTPHSHGPTDIVHACPAPIHHETPARAYFLTGWHPVEDWGTDRADVRWMRAGTGNITIFASPDTPSLHCSADFFPTLSDSFDSQTILIQSGTTEYARFDLKANEGWTHHEWNIPGPFTHDGLIVSIRSNRISTPSDRTSTHSDDTRILGAALSEFHAEDH